MFKSQLKAAAACVAVAAFSLAGSTAFARGGWAERYEDYHGRDGGYSEWDARGGHDPVPYYGDPEDRYVERSAPYGRLAPRWDEDEDQYEDRSGYAAERYERRYPPRYGRRPAAPEPAEFGDGVAPEPQAPPAVQLSAAAPQPAPGRTEQVLAPAPEPSAPAELVAAAPAPLPGLSAAEALIANPAEPPAAELAKPLLDAPPAMEVGVTAPVTELPALAEPAAPSFVSPGPMPSPLVDQPEPAKIVEAVPTVETPAIAPVEPGKSEALPALIAASARPAAGGVSSAALIAKEAPLAACDGAVKGERFTVGKVDSAGARDGGWEVKGRTSDGLNFTCQVDGKGQVALIDIDDLARE